MNLDRAWIAALMGATLAAGCISSDDAPSDEPGGAAPPLSALDIPVVDFEHDHLDPALHPERSSGLHQVAAIRFVDGALPAAGVLEAGLGGRMVLVEDLLFIVTDRDQSVGISIVDVSRPRAPVALGHYKSDYGTSEAEAIAVTADAAFAFVSIETSFNPQPRAAAIEIVDLADPAAPTLAARIPAADQPHVFTFAEIDGVEYLFVSGYQVSVFVPFLAGALPEVSAVSTQVTIYEFDRSGPTLRAVGAIRYDPAAVGEEPVFSHDLTVTTHPVTGETVLYVAAIGAGGHVYSLADPTMPAELGYTMDKGQAPVLRLHSFLPGLKAVDGVLPTAAVPRTFDSDAPGSAYLTLYDTADPAVPSILGQWRHPDPDFIPGDAPRLNLHIPWFFADGSKLLVPHFHAGLYVFDVSTREALADPQPVAFWLPPPGEVPSDAKFVEAVTTAAEVDGVILAADGISGMLYALELDL